MKDCSKLDKAVASGFLSYLGTHMRINNYTLENVVLGKLSPKSSIPFDNYVAELKIQNLNPYSFKDNLKSSVLDENRIVVNEPLDYFYKQYFADQVNMIYHNAPMLSETFGTDGLFNFKFDLSDYLLSLYPLFKEIVETDVKYEPFDLLNANQPLRTNFWYEAQLFISAIKIKRLRNGSCINRYIAKIPYFNNYLNRLIKKEKNKFYLRNANPDKLDYKLALFSIFYFETAENEKLFELKMQKWKNQDSSLSSV